MTRLSQIKSIGTAVPEFKHQQDEILRFMSRIYAFNEKERRTLKISISSEWHPSRYSVLSIIVKSLQTGLFIRQRKIWNPFLPLKKE